MTKMGNLDASIATYIDIWQRIARSQRKKRKLESARNITKQDTLQKTAGKNIK